MMKLSEEEFFKNIFGETSNGCRDHEDCFTCPYPACRFDGYRPKFNYKSFKHKAWTPREREHLKELLYTDISYKTLSNIFGREIEDIKQEVAKITEGYSI